MKRLMLAAASAVAIGLTAQAAEWFNGGIAEGWPNASTLSGGAWSNTDDTLYAGGVLDVDAPDDAPLTFTATEAKGPATSLSVEVSMTVTFTPFADVIAVPEGAKAGMIIAADKYYGIGKVEDAAAWVELGAASDVDLPKAIKVTRTTDGLVYSVDGTAFAAVTPVSEESFQYVKMTGTGTLASLSAVEDPGAATVNGKPYATVAAAFAAAKAGDTIKIVNAGTAALGTLATAATTVDLNGQVVDLAITFTDATADKVVVKNGEIAKYGSSAVTITAPGDLRFENVDFWGNVSPKSKTAGSVLEFSKCGILCGKTARDTYAPEQDGTVNVSFGSQRLTLTDSNFTVVDISESMIQWSNRPPIAGLAAGSVLYVYGCELDGRVNHNDKGDVTKRYPLVQGTTDATCYFENNTFVGKMAQGAFVAYNDGVGTYIVSSNKFGTAVESLSASNGGTPYPKGVYFGVNDTSEASIVIPEGGYYKTWFTIPWTTEQNIVLPESVESFYDWLHDDENGEKPFVVNGVFAEDLDDIKVGDVIVALPGTVPVIDTTKFSLVAAYANMWTVAEAVNDVALTVTVGENVQNVTYTKNGGDATALPAGGVIEGLVAKDVIVLAAEDNDGTHVIKAMLANGDLVQSGFTFTVKDELSSATARIDLTAETAFVKAVKLDGSESKLVEDIAEAWPYFTNGTHYVELLKDYSKSGGENQLSIQVGDVARIKRNGKSVRFFGAKNVCVVEDVDGAEYQTFTAYADLAAAWSAKKSAATYWLGFGASGGMGSTAIDASVITLDDDGLVFAGEMAPNTDGLPMAHFTKEPVTTASVTNAWGVTDGGWKFRYEVAASGPVPDPQDDDCTVTPNPDGSYTVTPNTGSTTATVKGVKATDTIKVTSAADFVLKTDVQPQAIVMELNGSVVPATYFKGGDATTGFNTALSDAAKATLVEESQEQKPLVIGDNVAVTINTVAGLKYQLIRGTEVGEITEALGEPVVGNGQALKLQDTNKPEGKAFYVIQTSK